MAAFSLYAECGLEDWQKNGPFVPPTGKFEIVCDSWHSPDRKLYLWPTALSYAYLFRGQGNFYPNCFPTLYRKELTYEELMIARMRLIEFELMLRQYPQVKYFNDLGLNVDFIGLAQHYGLDTDVLDLTSELGVALFFATCDYDSAAHRYRPKEDNGKEYIGYIYAYPFVGEMMGDPKSTADFLKRVKPIGLQPFERPGLQRGFSIRLNKGQSFTAPLFSFSYTAEDSKRLFEKYKNILVDDPLASATKRIADSDSISIAAIKLFCANHSYRLLGKRLTYDQCCTILKSHKIKPVATPEWVLSKQELERIFNDYASHGAHELGASLIHRKVKVGNGSLPYCDFDFIKQETLLNIFKLGCKSLEGYDSGITFLRDENNQYCGISYHYGREQTIPNETTLKVDKWDHLDWSLYESPTTYNRFEGNVPKMSLVRVPKNFSC